MNGLGDDSRVDTLVVLGVLAILAGMATRSTALGPAIGITATATAGVLFAFYRGRKDIALGILLVAALLARLAVVGVDELVGLFPKSDATGYHKTTAALADSWWTGSDRQGPVELKNNIYRLFIAPFYFVFGSSAVLARVVNVTLSLLAVYNVHRVGRAVFNRRAGLFAAAAFAFLPSIVRIHGEHLREALIIVLVTQVLYLLVSREVLELRGAIFGVGTLWLLFYLRRGTFVVLLLPLVLLLAHRFIYGQRSWDQMGNPSTLVKRTAGIVASLAAVTGIAAWIMGPSELMGILTGKGYIARITGFGPETIGEIRRPWVRGGSAYLSDYSFDGWLAAFIYIPLGAIYFLFTPFPWQIHNSLAAVAALENYLLFYPLTGLAVLQLRRKGIPASSLPLIAFFLAGALLYGLVEGNIGTALRHRAQFTWALFVFTGPILSRSYDRFIWWSDVNRSGAQRSANSPGDTDTGSASPG